MTHRQYLAWQEWHKEDWNHPGKNEWYLMQISADTRRANAKHPRQVRTEGSKIPFVFKQMQAETAYEDASQEDWSKADREKEELDRASKKAQAAHIAKWGKVRIVKRGEELPK